MPKEKTKPPRKPCTFRLQQETIAKLVWLAKMLGKDSGIEYTMTDTVEQAIHDLWIKIQKKKSNSA